MAEKDTGEEAPLLTQAPAIKRLRDVVVLGLAFLFLFSAFTVVQNLATSVFAGQVGFWSLGSLYIVFAFTTLIASSLVKALGLRLSLFVGGLTYIIYVIANVISVANPDNETLHYALMIPAGALEGFGGALLWTAQGAYLTFCSNDQNLGIHGGIFFTLFIANQVLGNVSAAILLDQDTETDLVFKILAAVAIFGLLIFGALRPVSRPPSAEKAKGFQPFEVVLFLSQRKALLLAPLLIYSGITQSFFFGSLPLFISEPVAEMNPLSLKLYLMGIFGVVDALASSVIGRLSDRFGRYPLLAFGSLVHIAGYALLLFGSPLNSIPILIPAACLLGIGDAAFNTQIYGILGFMFKDASEASFASYKFYRASSTGILFFASDSMRTAEGCTENSTCPNMLVWSLVLIIPLVAGMGLLTHMIRAGDAIDSTAQKKKDEKNLLSVNDQA